MRLKDKVAVDELPPGEQPGRPLPTAPENIQVTLRGYTDAGEVEQFGNTMGMVVREISRFINLERLDGVTIAYDCEGALSQLDRGVRGDETFDSHRRRR